MNEEKIKDMILKQCLELNTNNDFRPPISAYDGVDIDDVVRTCNQLQDKKTYLDLIKENKELKKQLHEASLTIQEMIEQDIECPSNCEKLRRLKKQLQENKDNYNCLLKQKEQFEYIMSKQVDYQGQKKEFVNYLENEKDRLARECNQIYEDSLGKTRLVNEDIFNEVDTILSKYKSIIGRDKK